MRKNRLISKQANSGPWNIQSTNDSCIHVHFICTCSTSSSQTEPNRKSTQIYQINQINQWFNCIRFVIQYNAIWYGMGYDNQSLQQFSQSQTLNCHLNLPDYESPIHWPVRMIWQLSKRQWWWPDNLQTANRSISITINIYNSVDWDSVWWIEIARFSCVKLN